MMWTLLLDLSLENSSTLHAADLIFNSFIRLLTAPPGSPRPGSVPCRILSW